METIRYWLNGRPDKAEFVEEVEQLHRTLQQLLFGMIMALIQHWARAYEAGTYDERNEFTCRVAKMIVEAVPDMRYDRPPYI